MQDIREAFAGRTAVVERRFLALRSEPTESAPTVALPMAGTVAPCDVWAEFQVGVNERSFSLVAKEGLIVDEWALKGLYPG